MFWLTLQLYITAVPKAKDIESVSIAMGHWLPLLLTALLMTTKQNLFEGVRHDEFLFPSDRA